MTTLANWLKTCPLPKLEARMLLQQVTGLTHAQLITHDADVLLDNQIAMLNQLLCRRQAGEPMAYILGHREFYGREFVVSPDTLIPRPETEHLLEAALFRLPENGILWDLGTGSGIIGISAKLERPDATIYASDISEAALKVAQQNAQRLSAKISLAQGSWFEANNIFALPENSVDVIVSNPPYIEQHDVHLQCGDLRFEPQIALTDFADGLNHIRHIACLAPQFLRSKGFLLFEHGFDQGVVVREILVQNGFAQPETVRDLAGNERVTFGQIC